MTGFHPDARIERVSARAYTIPTDGDEADGTIHWNATTIIVARVTAGGKTGLGYSYASSAAAGIIHETLAGVVAGMDARDVTRAWVAMGVAVRNTGKPGVASSAIAAVDAALWDLKARLADQPLLTLLGAARREIPAYGSGGFTSYSDDRLCEQLSRWASEGFGAVKMKIGECPDADLERVSRARRAIGAGVELYVDANGAYHAKQALKFAEQFATLGVTWFEEPVSSDALTDMRLVRERGPAGMRVAAGEYGYTLHDQRRMLAANAVDVLQADATRCGGPSGFLRAAALCEAHNIPFSAHTAPTLHATLACAAAPAINVEYFYDHARIERMLFDGATEPRGGMLVPDLTQPGLGLTLKAKDAEQYAA
jgi:L-alanine-DL-glutamate epimerase-like enolase superfamily enzyme